METPQRSAAITMLAATIVRSADNTAVQALMQRVADTTRVEWQRSAVLSGAEVALLDASSLLSNQDAFVTLRHADMIVMVIEARQSTIPVVSSALNILTTAFKKVDGIIVNRRRFEVPYSVLNLVSRLRSLA